MSLQILGSSLNKEPASPPPKTAPQYSPALRDLTPSFLYQCMRQMVYGWTIYGNSFWMVPVDIQGDNIYAYAWDGSEWKYIRFPMYIIDTIF